MSDLSQNPSIPPEKSPFADRAGAFWVWVVVLSLLALGVWQVLSIPALRTVDPDEAINLIKARTLGGDARLYGNLWSDQPPLLTMLAAGVYRVLGVGPDQGLTYGRLLSACLAAMSVFVVAAVARRSCAEAGGTSIRVGFATVVAAVLLVSSRSFVPLSTSFMVGLPAASLAAVSALLLAIALSSTAKTRLFSTIFSGFCLAGGLLIKLNVFTLLLPSLLLLAFVGESRWTRLRNLALYVVGLAGGFAVILLAASFVCDFGGLYEQLVRPHVQVAHDALSGDDDRFAWLRENLHDVARLLDDNLRLLAVTVIGAAFVLATNRGERRTSFSSAAALVGVGWLIASSVALVFASPVWYHHVTLLSFPAAIVAAAGVGVAAARAGRSGRLKWGHAVLAVLAVVMAGAATKKAFKVHRLPGDMKGDWSLDPTALQLAKDKGGRGYADYPLYVLAAGLEPVPELAVTTSKRRKRGMFSDEYILDLIDSDGVDAIVLSRWGKYSRSFHRTLKESFDLAYEDLDSDTTPSRRVRVYLRKPNNAK